jgi:hypothetical protein
MKMKNKKMTHNHVYLVRDNEGSFKIYGNKPEKSDFPVGHRIFEVSEKANMKQFLRFYQAGSHKKFQEV